MIKRVQFAFDEDLLGLLPKVRRITPLTYAFSGPQSAKHLIEAMGIPHTEVGVLVVAGAATELGYLVQDGDRLEVRGAAVMDSPHGEPRFVVDGHLGRLAAGLRMLGLDCAYSREALDDQLFSVALSESRFLLTRDRRLLMRKNLVMGSLVRSLDPRVQLEETCRRFSLRAWAAPFRRCIRCNHLLASVDKVAIMDRLQPLTKMHFNEFRLCPSCKQIYWKGSHLERMQERIAELLAGGSR